MVDDPDRPPAAVVSRRQVIDLPEVRPSVAKHRLRRRRIF